MKRHIIIHLSKFAVFSSRINTLAKRGIIRHLCVIVDGSEASNDKEWSPSKLSAIFSFLKNTFSHLFFESNPIGQLSIITTQNGTAKVLVNPKSDFNSMKKSLDTLTLEEGLGLASLETSLILSMALFQ